MKNVKLFYALIIFLFMVSFSFGCMDIQRFSLTEDSFFSSAKPPDMEESNVRSYNGEDIDHHLYGRYFDDSIEAFSFLWENEGTQQPEGNLPDYLTAAGENSDLDITQVSSQELISLFSFLSHPVQGAKVSSVDGQLPNAPRRYRNGVHEGLDYYSGSSGVSVTKNTPVLAAGPGMVIRADHGFQEMTREEYEEAVKISHEAEITPEELLDKFRGKQVWIRHEQGIVTRYAHLNSIESGIQVGTVVDKGQKIGTTGNTGTRDSVNNTGQGIHLHFEVWLNGAFLGKDRPVSEVRDIYKQVLK